MKNIIFILLMFPFNSNCQDRLNVLMTMDEVVVASYNISDTYIVVHNDTIKLKYEVGRFEIENTDMEKLKKFDKNEEVILNLKYFAVCPYQKTYQYSLRLKLDLITQEYFLLRIYNFEIYPKTFREDKGYGFEYNSPIESLQLPKKKKIKRNSCIN